MDFYMTFTTSRQNIEPMLFGVTFMVMPVLCLFGAFMALKNIGVNQLANFYRIPYSLVRRAFIGILISIFNTRLFLTYSPLFTLKPFFHIFFTMIIVGIFVLAQSTTWLIAASSIISWWIFCEWFNYFAFSASFRYDSFRHNRFSNKRFLLGPVTTLIVPGSFYYTQI